MYPKVKVKEEEGDDLLTVDAIDLESLSTSKFNSPVSEHEDDSPTSVVRIPDSYVPGPASLSQGEALGKNKKKSSENNNATNVRASPVPPPRAVLSSPDNDELIRSKNKAKAELFSGLRDHNSCENRHIRCKVIPRRSSPASSRTTRLQAMTDTKEKTRAGGVADSRQRSQERKQRPEWI